MLATNLKFISKDRLIPVCVIVNFQELLIVYFSDEEFKAQSLTFELQSYSVYYALTSHRQFGANQLILVLHFL